MNRIDPIAILLFAATAPALPDTPRPRPPLPSCECRRLGLAGSTLLNQSRFSDAERTFAQALEAAGREKHRANVCKFHNNLGGAQLHQLKYSPAFANFLQARQMARDLGEREVEAGAWVNLAVMYTMLGARDAADFALGQGSRLLPATSAAVPQLLSQRAVLAARRKDFGNACRLWQTAMRSAQDAGNLRLEETLWELLGMIRMAEGDWRAAEDALANQYRITRLHRIPARAHIYTQVGRLRLAQGRSAEAVAWFARERRERLGGNAVAPWISAQDYASALSASGRYRDALNEYRHAWRLGLAWRQDLLPSRATDLAGDVSLAELASQYARTALAEPAAGAPAEAWAAIEQGRAAGLRRQAMQRGTTLQTLDPEYQRLLAARRRLVTGGDERAAPALEARLTELEARAGVFSVQESAMAAAPPAELLARVRTGLAGDQVLFTFHTAEPESFVWAVTRDRLAMARLPGRAALAKAAEAFRRSVENAQEGMDQRAHRFFLTLFGGLPLSALQQPNWILSLDGPLFDTPLAALRESPTPGAPYLVERHSLRRVPSALWLLRPLPPPAGGSLLAVGDAIHNAADPRLRLRRQSFAPLSFWVWPVRTLPPPRLQTMELPALAGSLQEVRSVASVWRHAGRPATLLTGRTAAQEEVEQALRSGYSVLHFATHVVPAPTADPDFLVRLQPNSASSRTAVAVGVPGEPLLTLSINQDGEREGLNAGILASHQAHGALVVLSGCSSGAGAALPGAGLSGFTSAWLASGARSVVASLWPVGDDAESFFSQFYKAILNGAPPAAALRSAQLEAIHSASSRAHPRYWATYFNVGKE